MIIFYLITGAVLVALLYVFWLIWQEQNQDASDGPSAKPDKDEHISAAGILDRIGIKPTPPKKKEGLKKFFPHLGLKEKSNPEQSEPDPATAKLQDPPETGTASLRLDHKEQQSINTEVELSIKNDELQHALEDLQEKYQKVDQLLKEKNDTLEKSQKELEQERKNRKEFNKVKDLLEKELKEANDRTKKAQIDFSAFKAESQTYTNRINQLEEKIKTLEKSLNEKNALIKDNEEKINILNQKIAEAKPVVPAGEAISTQQPSSSETVAQPAESNKSIENEIVPAETTPIASATPQDKIPELPLEAASSSTKKSEEEEPFLS
ncbi:MAG TPA: hypothetical protein VLJ10_05380, partial [Candidatus Bathyarchaeia archaeon]|nr:hypothetical protein [Candidatus Bathyarchaeia archaeon]